MSSDSILKGGLVVAMRPQVSVDLGVDGDVVISACFISEDFNAVQHAELRFPVECASEIANAILEVAGVSAAQVAG